MGGGGARTTETEPNNDSEHAEKLTLPVCIEGEMKPEDVDVFAVELKKDQRLTAVVEAIRLGRTHARPASFGGGCQPVRAGGLRRHGAAGQDPMVSVVAPADGTYFLYVRDAAYEGADGARYRLSVGALAATGRGAAAGRRTGRDHPGDMAFFPTAARKSARSLADGAPERAALFTPVPDGVDVPGALACACRADAWGEETAPNNAREQATPGAGGIAGRAARHPGKTRRRRLVCRADEKRPGGGTRRHGPGGSVRRRIWRWTFSRPDGKHIGGNDDTDERAGSEVLGKATADGVYFVRVRESLAAGGPGMFYRIEARGTRQPSLALSLPARAVNDSQAGQTVMVPQGNRVARVFNISRNRAGGGLALELRDAPPGLNFTATHRTGVTQALVLFSASRGAAEAGAFADMVVKKQTAAVEGRYRHDGQSGDLSEQRANLPDLRQPPGCWAWARRCRYTWNAAATAHRARRRQS